MALAAGKLSPVHEQIIDYICANPAAKAEQIAQFFNYSPSYIRALSSNDLFKARLHERQAMISAMTAQRISGQITELAEKGLERLLQKVKVEENHSEIRDTVKLALQGTGHITPKGTAPVHLQQNNNAPSIHFHGVDKALLETARAKMLGLSAPKALDHATQLPEG